MCNEPLPEMRLPAIAVTSIDGVAELLMMPGESSDVGTFPIRRAGKKAAVRFAVGEPGRRGTVWRLWASRDTDDVYLASRQTAGEVKFSLHQSGDWRMQIVEPDRPKTVRFAGRSDTDGRILHRWERPAPNAVGWTHALSIVLPETHLHGIPYDGVKWDDVRWCPAPGTGEQVEFEVYVVKPKRGMMTYRDLLFSGGRVAVMDALQLASGEVAIVLALTVPTTEEEAAVIARCEELARSSVPDASDFDRAPELAPRQLISGVVGNGRRRHYDLAFPQPA